MKRVLLAISLLLSMQGVAHAECPNQVATEGFAHEILTVSNTATFLTSSTYSPVGAQGASMAVLTVESDSLRFWADGTVPTSSQGLLALSGSVIYLCSNRDIRLFKAIRSAGTDVPVQAQYFRAGQ